MKLSLSNNDNQAAMNQADIDLMDSSSDSICMYLDLLFKKTSFLDSQDFDSSKKRELAHEKQLLFEKITRVILNWMAKGRTEDIDELIESVPHLLKKYQSEKNSSPSLNLFEQSIISSVELRRILSVHRKSQDLSLPMEIVSSKRRQSWRDLLVYMSECDRPIDVKEILEKIPSFNKENTVNYALKQLRIKELISREKSAGRYLYFLTYEGRAIAREVQKNDEVASATDTSRDDEKEMMEPPISPIETNGPPVEYKLVCNIIPFQKSESNLLKATNYKCQPESIKNQPIEIIVETTPL